MCVGSIFAVSCTNFRSYLLYPIAVKAWEENQKWKCLSHFFFSGETTVGQNDHDIKLNGALVAETHWYASVLFSWVVLAIGVALFLLKKMISFSSSVYYGMMEKRSQSLH